MPRYYYPWHASQAISFLNFTCQHFDAFDIMLENLHIIAKTNFKKYIKKMFHVQNNRYEKKKKCLVAHIYICNILTKSVVHRISYYTANELCTFENIGGSSRCGGLHMVQIEAHIYLII